MPVTPMSFHPTISLLFHVCCRLLPDHFSCHFFSIAVSGFFVATLPFPDFFLFVEKLLSFFAQPKIFHFEVIPNSGTKYPGFQPFPVGYFSFNVLGTCVWPIPFFWFLFVFRWDSPFGRLLLTQVILLDLQIYRDSFVSKLFSHCFVKIDFQYF